MKTIISFLFLCFLSIGTKADPNPFYEKTFHLVPSEKILFGTKVGGAVDYLLSRQGNDATEIIELYHSVEMYLSCDGKTNITPEKIRELRGKAYASSAEIYLTEPGVNVKEVADLINKAMLEREYDQLCFQQDLGFPIDPNYLVTLEEKIWGKEEEVSGVLLFDKHGITLAFGDGELSSLVKNGILTDKYGNRSVHPVTKEENVFHAGIDIGVPLGTEITAPFSGVITKVQYSKHGFGNMIIIHNQCWPLHMLLGHLGSISVTEGQFVEAGMVIGTSGKTGVTSGPCIHVGAYWQGKLINPLSMFGEKKISKYSPFDGSAKNNQLFIGKVLQKEVGKVVLVKF